jgi:hypothetical protein
VIDCSDIATAQKVGDAAAVPALLLFSYLLRVPPHCAELQRVQGSFVRQLACSMLQMQL